jgi:hypothetical protein
MALGTRVVSYATPAFVAMRMDFQLRRWGSHGRDGSDGARDRRCRQGSAVVRRDCRRVPRNGFRGCGGSALAMPSLGTGADGGKG